MRVGSWKNGFIEIAGVDLSDHCTEYSVTESDAELPDHTHGGHVESIAPGLTNWAIKGTFLQDFAAGSVHKTLRGAKKAGLPVSVRYRHDRGVVSADNPMYSGSAYITTYDGYKGAHGATMLADVTLRPANNSDLVESTTP